jgi:hypothetical protein
MPRVTPTDSTTTGAARSGVSGEKFSASTSVTRTHLPPANSSQLP